MLADFQGFPGTNMVKTSLRPVVEASREFLEFMHLSVTVSDTVTDFQNIRCQAFKTGFDLSGKHWSSAVTDQRIPGAKQVKTSVDLYGPQAQCTSLRLCLAPWQTSGNLWC